MFLGSIAAKFLLRWPLLFPLAVIVSLQSCCSLTPAYTAPLPTPTTACVMTFSSPSENTVLPETGSILFEWTAIPDATRYNFSTILPNNGGQSDLTIHTNSRTLYADVFHSLGAYTFLVTAWNSNGDILCQAAITLKRIQPESLIISPPTTTATATAIVINFPTPTSKSNTKVPPTLHFERVTPSQIKPIIQKAKTATPTRDIPR
jgi:hypothetical protein